MKDMAMQLGKVAIGLLCLSVTLVIAWIVWTAIAAVALALWGLFQ